MKSRTKARFTSCSFVLCRIFKHSPVLSPICGYFWQFLAGFLTLLIPDIIIQALKSRTKARFTSCNFVPCRIFKHNLKRNKQKLITHLDYNKQRFREPQEQTRTLLKHSMLIRLYCLIMFFFSNWYSIKRTRYFSI